SPPLPETAAGGGGARGPGVDSQYGIHPKTETISGPRCAQFGAHPASRRPGGPGARARLRRPRLTRLGWRPRAWEVTVVATSLPTTVRGPVPRARGPGLGEWDGRMSMAGPYFIKGSPGL